MTREPEPGTPEAVDHARQTYEESVKRYDDAEALIGRTDSVVSMLRGERFANHWADKARAQLRGKTA